MRFTSVLRLVVLVLGIAACDRAERITTPTPPAPATFRVWAVAPPSAWMGIGTRVEIYGSGFLTGATVTLGAVASDVFVVSHDRIQLTTPTSGSGTVDVVVTNPNGATARLDRSFTYDVVTLEVSAPVVAAGAPLSVTCVIPGSRIRLLDWIGLFGLADHNTQYEKYGWQYVSQASSTGTYVFAAPRQPGQYEFRYLLDDDYFDVARSAAITVR